MFIVTIGRRKPLRVKTLPEASIAYTIAREKSGQGYSSFPFASVFDATTGKKVGHISYNGRVWGEEPWDWYEGKQPLYDPSNPST